MGSRQTHNGSLAQLLRSAFFSCSSSRSCRPVADGYIHAWCVESGTYDGYIHHCARQLVLFSSYQLLPMGTYMQEEFWRESSQFMERNPTIQGTYIPVLQFKERNPKSILVLVVAS